VGIGVIEGAALLALAPSLLQIFRNQRAISHGERGLSPEEKRAISRAVRRGEAVDEPELASAAVTRASISAEQARWSWRTALATIGALVLWSLPPVTLASQGRWVAAAFFALPPLGVLVLAVLGPRRARRAAEAERLNRRSDAATRPA
jgi:VIT1/CCC1 family predicted Fe2+/Mn2+ transporter